LRLIVHRTSDSLLLCYVDHHDKAYAWAEKHKLEVQSSTGEVRGDEDEGTACWFVDTDYIGESFFVRHAYFLGQNDTYKAFKTTQPLRPRSTREPGRASIAIPGPLTSRVLAASR